MSERLSNGQTLTVDRHADEPVTSPPEIAHCRVLQLSMAVCADDEQVTRVMADLWVKMMYFKVWFAVSFFKGERTKLTLPIM